MDVAVGTNSHAQRRGEVPAPPSQARDRREETTEEYPAAEDQPMEEGGHHSDRRSPPPSGNDDVQDPAKPEAEGRKLPASGARKKKRKKKKRDKPIPLPDVGSGETLVQIHTVWNRGKRTKGGYVVKMGDKVVRYIDSKGTIYCPEDTIYLDTKEPDQPFFICSIFGFTLKKRDTLSLVVKWFFRVSELPISVRDHLLQDRHNEHGSGGGPAVATERCCQRTRAGSSTTRRVLAAGKAGRKGPPIPEQLPASE